MAGYYDLPGVRRSQLLPLPGPTLAPGRAREVEMLRNRDREVRALLQAALRKLEDSTG